MKARVLLLCVVALVANHAVAQSSDATTRTASTSTLDEVLVSGEYPGPPLWKISKDDHVLWILGSYGVVPKGVKWKSSAAEAAIANSQEVLLGTSADDDSIGLFKGARYYLRWRKAAINPNGKLKDTLPLALYARFLSLKQTYAPDESHDLLFKLRPYYAGVQLYQSSLDQLRRGFEWGPQVSEEVRKLAKRHHVKTRSIEYELKPEHRMKANIEQSIALLTSNSIDTEIACLTRNLEGFEQRVEHAKRSFANEDARLAAWARGNLTVLRENIVDAPEPYACGETSIGRASQQRGREMREVRERAWTDGALDALARNNVTFAIYAVNRLLDENGPLKEFKERGLTVEEN